MVNNAWLGVNNGRDNPQKKKKPENNLRYILDALRLNSSPIKQEIGSLI